MECEVCGKLINGSPRIVNIEGALMRVCANCTRYGKGVTSPKKARRVERAPGIPPPQFPTEPIKRKKKEIKTWAAEEQWICRNCGAEIPAGKYSCPECGAPVVE